MCHGARKLKFRSALRLSSRSDSVSLWPLAKLCLSAEDELRFTRLDHVQTELGRGRAWLRAAINERTLENFLHIIIAQEEQLRYVELTPLYAVTMETTPVCISFALIVIEMTKSVT